MRSHGRLPVVHGRLGHKQRAAVTAQLTPGDTSAPILLVATTSFVGEGFDCPPLDTVFLAFPLRLEGKRRSVRRAGDAGVGRKQNVEVHDYVDVRIPVIRRMHDKRLVGYSLLGFDVPRARRRR